MIAFSTCWNSSRHTTGDSMLREIRDELGFDLIELGHGIRISLMPGIQKIFESGEMRFSSLHNFCPLPVEVMGASPDCYTFSARTAAERHRAVKQTLQTIDFAARLDAAFVVLHCGKVPIAPVTEPLVTLAKQGKMFSRDYVRRKVAAVAARETHAPTYLERVKECLKPIIEYAAKKNVKLGIEGRRGYEEIPSERELPDLLEELAAPHVGYWHDMGHLQVKENLGFVDHAEWLAKIGPRTFGCHLQDCRWPAQDHQVPFSGEIDFANLIPLLPTDCLYVWELSPRKAAEEIRQSVNLWKERYGQ